MAMSSSTVSFRPLSLSKTLSSPSKITHPPSLFIFPSSGNPLPKLSSLETTPSSRFVRTLAAASSYELGDDVLSDGDEEQLPNYSPDLKVYVGNLPWNVDSAALAGLFQRAGNVEMVEVVYDKVSGRSKGFGFVTMSSIEEVETATRQFNGYELGGRLLKVNSGSPPSRGSRDGAHSSFGDGSGGGRSSNDTNKVYVGNLAWSIDNLALETLFQDQGKVVEARVVYDRNSGRSKGFGFVTYSSVDEVNRAIESLDGLHVDGRNIRVAVAEARRRNEF